MSETPFRLCSIEQAVENGSHRGFMGQNQLQAPEIKFYIGTRECSGCRQVSGGGGARGDCGGAQGGHCGKPVSCRGTSIQQGSRGRHCPPTNGLPRSRAATGKTPSVPIVSFPYPYLICQALKFAGITLTRLSPILKGMACSGPGLLSVHLSLSLSITIKHRCFSIGQRCCLLPTCAQASLLWYQLERRLLANMPVHPCPLPACIQPAYTSLLPLISMRIAGPLAV